MNFSYIDIMSVVDLEAHVKEFLTNKSMSPQVLVSLTASLVSQVAMKDMSLENKKKAVCCALETALKNNSTGMPAEEISGLSYVIKNIVPHLVDLLGSFSVNALEKKVEKEVIAVAKTYWDTCLSCLPSIFRGRVEAVAAETLKKVEAAAPELVKKAEDAAAPVVAAAVAAAVDVAGPEAAKAVAVVVEAVEKKVEEAAVASPEKIDVAAAVPDWSAPVDLSGATVPSNPV